MIEHIWRLDWRSGGLIWAGLRYHVEDLRSPFQLSTSSFVPPGRYAYPELEANFFLPNGWPFHGSLWTENGRFFDGHFNVFQIDPEWNIFPHLTAGVSYIFNRVYFPGRGQTFRGARDRNPGASRPYSIPYQSEEHFRMESESAR